MTELESGSFKKRESRNVHLPSDAQRCGHDWLNRSPFSKARKGELIAVAHEAKRQVVLSPENEARLLAACSSDKRRHLKAMIIAAIDTGCRQGELRCLRWSDVDCKPTLLRSQTKCSLSRLKLLPTYSLECGISSRVKVFWCGNR